MLIAEVTAVRSLERTITKTLPGTLVPRLQSSTLVFIHLIEYISCAGSLQPSPSPRNSPFSTPRPPQNSPTGYAVSISTLQRGTSRGNSGYNSFIVLFYKSEVVPRRSSNQCSNVFQSDRFVDCLLITLYLVMFRVTALRTETVSVTYEPP